MAEFHADPEYWFNRAVEYEARAAKHADPKEAAAWKQMAERYLQQAMKVAGF